MICKKCGDMVKRLTKNSKMCEPCKNKSEKLRHVKAMRTKKAMGWNITKLPSRKDVLKLMESEDV